MNIVMPGLYAVIKDTEIASDSAVLHTLQVVTAFKYTYYSSRTKEIFSEPLVYCESKRTNALVAGRSKIEFVGSLENCALKIKELDALYYTKKNIRKNENIRKNALAHRSRW